MNITKEQEAKLRKMFDDWFNNLNDNDPMRDVLHDAKTKELYFWKWADTVSADTL